MKISIYNTWDMEDKVSAEGEKEVVLCFFGEYRKNDVIFFSGLEYGSFYKVWIDAAVGEALIYVTTREIRYTVPFYEKRESYHPLAFTGCRHYIRIRKAEAWEIQGTRNLALNPFDQHEAEGVYPHASANVETRGESVFAARNAVDGMVATAGHGEWPYESWGINRQEDAVLLLDFGRKVDIEEIRLYTRADFPHDSWWTKGLLHFSDGTEKIIKMEKSLGKPHIFSGFKLKGIEWLSLGYLKKAEDHSPFPALTQIEVIGNESI